MRFCGPRLLGPRRLAGACLVWCLVLTAFLVPVHNVVAASTADRGGYPGALAEAAATGEPVEVAELTTETRRVLANPDGTFDAEVSAEPARVRRDGGWVPVDTTLVARADGTVAPVAAALDVSFSGGGSGPLVRLADGARSVELGWTGSLPAPVLSGDRALYQEVIPDVDLIVQAGAEGFSTFLVVRTAEAAASPALDRVSLPFASTEMTVSRGAEGGVRAADGEGRVIFDGPPARMWDSSDNSAQDEAGARAAAPPDPFAPIVQPTGRESVAPIDVVGNTLTITPDQNLLEGPDTVYPVVIDPSLSKAVERKSWTMVWSNGYTFRNSPTEHARVGFDGWSGQHKVSRVFYELDTSAFRGKHILKAVWRHKQNHSPRWNCDKVDADPGVVLYRTGATSKSTSWNNQPTWVQQLSVNKKTHGHEKVCAGYTTVEWDAEAAVEVAAAKKWATLTLGMRSADEGDKWGWRKYDNTSSEPVLTVKYSSPPTKPGSLTFFNPDKDCGSATNPTLLGFPEPLAPRPTLQAVLTDPDPASLLKGTFEVRSRVSGSPDALVWSAATSGTVHPGTPIKLALNKNLTDGVLYYFRVRGEESYPDAGLGSEPIDVSPWSGSCWFTVDSDPPPAPSVSSTAYPPLDQTGTAHGGVGTAGLFQFRGGADVARYDYRLNDGDWRTVRPAATGGSVTLSLAPSKQDVNSLVVVARDGAGFVSEDRVYRFKVKPGVPPQRVWSFDDASGSTVADSCVWTTKRPLTVVTGSSNPGWSTRIGRLTGSLVLDGVDDYATANDFALSTEYSFTISTWVRLHGNADNMAVAHQVRSDGKLGFLLYYSKQSNRWGFQRPHPDNPNTPVTAYSARPPALNTWTHLIGTYDDTTDELRLYVNGVLQDTVSYPHRFDNTGMFEVGRWNYPGHTGVPLRGRVDQTQAYSRVLGPTEIASLVRLPNDGDIGQPELTGRWTFDETSGTTATDSSGYGGAADLESGTRLVSDPEHGRVLRVNSTLAGRATTSSALVDSSGSFTVMAWVKADSLSGRGFVLSNGSAGTTPDGYESYGLGLAKSGTPRWEFTRQGQRGTAGEEVVATVASEPLEAEDLANWVHLAAVHDSTTQRMFLYVNGVLQGDDEGVPFDAAWHAGGPVVIGGDITGSAATSTFAGLIDDVRVYAGALTEGQVKLARLGAF